MSSMPPAATVVPASAPRFRIGLGFCTCALHCVDAAASCDGSLAPCSLWAVKTFCIDPKVPGETMGRSSMPSSVAVPPAASRSFCTCGLGCCSAGSTAFRPTARVSVGGSTSSGLLPPPSAVEHSSSSLQLSMRSSMTSCSTRSRTPLIVLATTSIASLVSWSLPSTSCLCFFIRLLLSSSTCRTICIVRSSFFLSNALARNHGSRSSSRV